MSDVHALTAFSLLTFSEADDDAVADRVRAGTAPSGRFRLSGRSVDVDGYLEHIRGLRAAMDAGELTAVEEVTDGRRVAGRYLVRMAMHDGSVVRGEAHLVGVLDDEGRIAEFYEIGRVVTDTDDPV